MGSRRNFLRLSGAATLGILTPGPQAHAVFKKVNTETKKFSKPRDRGEPIRVFLCGDVMLGRGIDQVLPHPSDPRIYEPYVTSALGYVELAERVNGPIPKPVDFSYVWGDALDELNRAAPDVRVINLETSVTTSEERVRKLINYRMHPHNVPCIAAADIDCCTLANNHVLDWGEQGLVETLDVLRKAKVKTAGAGRNLAQAEAPAVLDVADKGRVIVFAFGSRTSGIPTGWAATPDRAGVNWLGDLSGAAIKKIAAQVRAVKRPGDITIASIHWGSNWGYGIPRDQKRFAHRLVDKAGVDVVHGHSSHHPKGIEVYNGRPIIYGCGDFLNDYEGIRGYEEYRGDLSLMYFLTFDPASGKLARFDMMPIQMRRFRLNRVTDPDARWLQKTLDRESAELGARVDLADDGSLSLEWRRADA